MVVVHADDVGLVEVKRSAVGKAVDDGAGAFGLIHIILEVQAAEDPGKTKPVFFACETILSNVFSISKLITPEYILSRMQYTTTPKPLQRHAASTAKGFSDETGSTCRRKRSFSHAESV